MREVALRQTADGDLVAVDTEARALGEIVTIELLIDSAPALRQMRVVSSCPIVREGMVMHEMRLAPVKGDNGHNGDNGDTENR